MVNQEVNQIFSGEKQKKNPFIFSKTVVETGRESLGAFSFFLPAFSSGFLSGSP